MNGIRSLLVWVLPLVQGVLFLLAIHYPSLFFIFSCITIVLTDIGIALIIPKKTTHALVFFTTLPCVALALSTAGCLIFLENIKLSYALICVQTLLQCLYFLNLTYYFHKSEKYQKRLFAHISQAINSVNIFLFTSICFALVYYLDIKFWHLLPFFIGIPLIFFIATHRIYTIQFSSLRSSIPILVLIFFEVLLTLQWLSFMWYAAALLFTFFYITLENINIALQLQEFTKSKLIFHFILLASVVVLVVLSTPF